MIYKINKGLRVCEKGQVIIENTRHYIVNGFVICNESLNNKAWGITEEENICDKCLGIRKRNRLIRHNERMSKYAK